MPRIIKMRRLNRLMKSVGLFKGHSHVRTTSASNSPTEPSPMESSSAEPPFAESECSYAEPSYAESTFSGSSSKASSFANPSFAESECSFANPSFAESECSFGETIFAESTIAEPPFGQPECSYEKPFYAEPSYAESTSSESSSFANPSFAESECSFGESVFAESTIAKPSFTEPSLPGRTASPLLERAASPSPDRTTSQSIYATTRPSSDRTEPQPQPSSLDYSPFTQLPIEIFQLIATFLSLPAAASLTLTCRSARFILGSQYLDQFRPRGSGWRRRPAFLYLLARDLPGHILCIECERLHSRTQKQIHEATPCKKADYKSFASLYIHPEFDSITFRLAMKLYQSGLDYSDQLSRLSGFGTIPRTDHIQHWESTPRIVNGHFLLRNKTWLLFTAGVTEASMTTIDACICPGWHKAPTQATHLTKSHYPKGYTELATQRPLTLKLSCRASHWDNAHLNSNCATCSGLSQCKFCPTEFQIGVGLSTENGVALTITRWLDLGEGRSLEDSTYASHVYGYEGRPVRFKAGSIKAAYEGGDSAEKLVTPKYTTGMFKRRAVIESHTAGSTKASSES